MYGLSIVMFTVDLRSFCKDHGQGHHGQGHHGQGHHGQGHVHLSVNILETMRDIYGLSIGLFTFDVEQF